MMSPTLHNKLSMASRAIAMDIGKCTISWEQPSCYTYALFPSTQSSIGSASQSLALHASNWDNNLTQRFSSVLPTEMENIVDFSNLKIETPHTALKSTLWPVFEYITAHQIPWVSFCGPVVDKESNYITYCGKSSKTEKVVDLQVKS